MASATPPPAQDVADVVRVRRQRRPDGKRRMAAEMRDQFAPAMRVRQAFVGLLAQPIDATDVVAIRISRSSSVS
ncbi:MAG: hypothetical protein GZ085_11825 [Sulfuriferula multivorans]|uniref:Uncharacterized protein n=1 Tax=Sulfuriferula multivorans TaxID=1559896 RepID=A0A7C9TDC9_9PROT|nr:hypothetical protein [Sulfuriferula multivorans]